jgi:type I restriction-modification system DNA methylase subunit
MQISEFRNSIEKISASYNKKKETKFNENHLTVDTLMPFMKSQLNLSCLFDDTNTDGKRPDLKCYLSEEDKEQGKNLVIAVESKKPYELDGLTLKKVFEKYLEDKVIPYTLEAEDSIKWLIIQSFNRFIFVEITDKVLIELHSYEASTKNKEAKKRVVECLAKSSKDFNIDKKYKRDRTKEIKSVTSYFISKTSHESLSLNFDDAYINSFVIKDNKSLLKFCNSLSKEIIGDEEEEGFYDILSDIFYTELDKETSHLKISYRLFLSTRFPEIFTSEEIDQKDSDDERELFLMATIYNLILKIFILKYVEDLYQGEESIIDLKDKLLGTSISSLDNQDVEDFITDVFASAIEKSPEALKVILSQNDFFNWVTKFDCLNNQKFRKIIMIFQSLDFNESVNVNNFKKDILGAFFEHLSENFSKNTRKVLGQYYTPKEVVSFIWNRVLGVAESLGTNLEEARILDPACGSGTFVVEGLKQLSEIGYSGKIIGFDTSPLATGMAEINIYSELLRQTPINKRKEINKVDVYCTDSLKITENAYWQSRLGEEDDLARKRMLDNEQEIAKKHKKKKEYTLVVTNPPYNGKSNRSLESFKGSFDLLDYLIEKKHADDRVRDDYVWFFGAIDRYINDNGFVGLITSDTYLYKRTYSSLRSYLYENYKVHEVYQLGENIFDDVKVATSIIILSKLDDKKALKKSNEAIKYYNLKDCIQNKKDRNLDERYMFFRGEKKLKPVDVYPHEENSYGFVPVTVVKNTVPFFASKKGNGIVSSKQPGVVPGFIDLFIDIDKNNLTRRMEEFFKIVSSAKRKVGKVHVSSETTNDKIRELGVEIHENVKFKAIQTKIDNFLKDRDLIQVERTENKHLYTALLLASAILRGVTFNEKKIVQASQLHPDTKWSFSNKEILKIYLDENLSIPRITQNGSKISGGPITCWRKEHFAGNKIVFTTPSGKGGYSRATLCSKRLNPALLKTVKGGQAEAHFCTVSDLNIPDSFAEYIDNKLDLFLYSQGFVNSGWAVKNADYIVSNRLPVPIPNVENKLLVKRVISYSKNLNDLGKLYGMIEFQLAPLKDEFFFSSEWLKKLKIAKFSKDTMKKITLPSLVKVIEFYQKKLDDTVEAIFRVNLNYKADDFSNIIPFKKKGVFKPKTKFDNVLLKRMGLSAYICKTFDSDKNLGRTKHQKLFFMLDSLIDDDLETSYEKQAAGPLDQAFIYNKTSGIEALAEEYGIFKVHEPTSKGFVKYETIQKAGMYAKVGEELASKHSKEINKILRMFKGADAKTSEVIATIYAIWNDLKVDKKKVTVNILVAEFLENWHKQKKVKFEGEEIFIKRIIKKIREDEIEPSGKKRLMAS